MRIDTDWDRSTSTSTSGRASAAARSSMELHHYMSMSSSATATSSAGKHTDSKQRSKGQDQNNAIDMSKISASVLDAVRTRPRDVAPFLKNLRRMLTEESDAVLRWTPDGRAFEIHDMQRMSDSVLPKYFKHRKYTSFQRQLNYFGFRKWTKSKALVCTFSNDCFLRDRPELACYISRKTTSVPLSNSNSKSSPRSVRECASIRDAPAELAAQFIDATRFGEQPEYRSAGARAGLASRGDNSACAPTMNEVALLAPCNKLPVDAYCEAQSSSSTSPSAVAAQLAHQAAEAHCFARHRVRRHGHRRLHGNSNDSDATSGMVSFRWTDDPFRPSLASTRAHGGGDASYFGHPLLSHNAARLTHRALGSDCVESSGM